MIKDDDDREITEARVALMDIGVRMTPIMEAVAGHKEEAVRRGFSEQAAELMAVSYHSALMQMYFSRLVRR